MTFSKRQIAEFKSKRRSYIIWRKNLKPRKIKEAFYNDREKTLKEIFPDKNLEYCHCDMYEIVVGDFKLGVKYVNEKGTYYMFLTANSFWAYPQDIAVGKAVDGQIYLVREHYPNYEYNINFRVIPEGYVNRNELGFRPRSYNHHLFVHPSRIEQTIEEITDEDIKCLKIAYEGIREFSKLIAEYYN